MANLVSVAPGAAFSPLVHLHAKPRLSSANEKNLPTAHAAALSLRESDSSALKSGLNSVCCREHRDQLCVADLDRRLRNASVGFRRARGKRRSSELKICRTLRKYGNRGSAVVSQKVADDDEIVELPVSVDFVSSPGNAYVKQLVKLRMSAKARSSARSVMVAGAVPLREICRQTRSGQGATGYQLRIDVLLVRQSAEVAPDLAAVSSRIVRVGPSAMSKLSGLESSPEVVGVLKFPSTFCALESIATENIVTLMEQNWCRSPRRILVLDRIQDPGNLGTLLRTVAAFSWDAVFLLPGCCDPFNDKALRAARGASFHVPVASGEWAQVRAFASAKGLRLYAGDPEPDSGGARGNGGLIARRDDGLVGARPVIRDGEGLCLILGSEGQGLSEEVRTDCIRIGIAMPGNFESLNVAVAGGILMFALS